MKCFGMPMGMWALFAGSFRKQLTDVLGYDTGAAKAVARKARPKYKEVISGLPEFEKADRFKMNIVNAALVASFILRSETCHLAITKARKSCTTSAFPFRKTV